jgi:hypothetical protein
VGFTPGMSPLRMTIRTIYALQGLHRKLESQIKGPPSARIAGP